MKKEALDALVQRVDSLVVAAEKQKQRVEEAHNRMFRLEREPHWSPPLIRDDCMDTLRVVTQEDVDALLKIREAYRKVLEGVSDTHEVTFKGEIR